MNLIIVASHLMDSMMPSWSWVCSAKDSFLPRNPVGTKWLLNRMPVIVLLALVARKVLVGHQTMSYVHRHRGQVTCDAMLDNKTFVHCVESLPSNQSTFVLIFNQHALNMTMNWLCNTHKMTGVHGRLLIVTLDRNADRMLAEVWPSIRRLHWEVAALAEPFNYGDGRYQLFYVLRANLALALLRLGKEFWMVQQDTFWSNNPLDAISSNSTADIIFDKADESVDGKLISGGYYFARPTHRAINYFEKLAKKLVSAYTPDNALMTHLCGDDSLATCDYIPFSLVTNWLWLYEPERRPNGVIPALIQFDGETRTGGKLLRMKENGFYFMIDRQNTTELGHYQCHYDSVLGAKERVSNLSALLKNVPCNDGYSKAALISKVWSHRQFGFYQWVIDQLNKCTVTSAFLNTIVFPRAHYFMITL